MKIIKKMKIIKFNLNIKKMGKKINNNLISNNTIKEEEENNNLILSSNKIKDNNDLISGNKLNDFLHELSHYQLPRCVHAYTKLFNELKEEDTINKSLENLEEISKNISHICTCNKEKNTSSIYSINLLSCLIPMEHVQNYNVELNTNKNIKNKKTTIDTNSLRCQTFSINPKPKPGNIQYLLNKNPTFKISNYLFDQKPIIFNPKKPKKKVKFVDEIYNKSLIEEVCIKSFKGYNLRNNYTSSSDSLTNCKVCKNTVCCSIF